MDAVIDGYLSDLDALAALAAVDIEPPPPGYDEWNAIRLATGRPCGAFWEYLQDTDRNTLRYWPALIYFGAVDDDPDVPGVDEVES